MRTELIGVRLPLHDAALVRRQAADKGITKSQHAANLLTRGLYVEAQQQFPVALGRLEAVVESLTTIVKAESVQKDSGGSAVLKALPFELRAFMIEVLLLLRHIAKDDLRVKGEIGRKLQRAVGDVRVEGT